MLVSLLPLLLIAAASAALVGMVHVRSDRRSVALLREYQTRHGGRLRQDGRCLVDDTGGLTIEWDGSTIAVTFALARSLPAPISFVTRTTHDDAAAMKRGASLRKTGIPAVDAFYVPLTGDSTVLREILHESAVASLVNVRELGGRVRP